LTSSGRITIISESIMDGHTCYHCKQWVEAGEAHDCWTTTEAALTAELDDDLREAWERLRETAAEFGGQRIYASHKSIMFSRQSCYFFVRPKRSFLEVNVFLGRAIQAPQIKKAVRSSAAKTLHVLHIRHRDEVEAPMSTWLREAYELAAEPKKGNTKDTKDTKGTKVTKLTKVAKAATRVKRKAGTASGGKKKAARAGRAKAPAARASAAKTRRRPR
jgi:hypothetical protein